MTAKKMGTYRHDRMSVQMGVPGPCYVHCRLLQPDRKAAGQSCCRQQHANSLHYPFCVGVVENSEPCGSLDLWQAISLQAAQPELTPMPVSCKNAQDWLTPRRLLTMVRPSGADRAASARTMALTEHKIDSRLLIFTAMLLCLAGVKK